MANRCSSDPRGGPGLLAGCVAVLLALAPLAAQVPPLPAPSSKQAPASTSVAAREAQSLSQRAAERVAALEHESEALAAHEQTLLTELRKLEVDRQLKSQQLAQVQADHAAVQRQLADTAARASQLQAEADRQEPDVDARLVELYKMGHAGYWRLLLDVDNLQGLARAYRTAAALGRIDRDRIAEHHRTLTSLQQERTALEIHARDLQKLELKDRDVRAALDRAVKAHTDLVKSIDAHRDLNAQLTGELEDAQRKLYGSLVQLAAGNTATVPGLPLRPFQGALPWPADGIVSARFGRQTDQLGAAILRSGIELSLAEGAPVRAVHDGTVAYAAPFSGYGNLVIVDHGEQSYSLYGFLDSIQVHPGERVEPSTTVGLAGRNLAGNPSLYFELRVDGQAVDPLQWLKRR